MTIILMRNSLASAIVNEHESIFNKFLLRRETDRGSLNK